MQIIHRLAVLSLLAFTASFASAKYPSSIDQLGFIAGTWRGELFGEKIEEHWSQPEAYHMVGVFRMWNTQGPSLYELCEFVETPSPDTADVQEILLRFKHINAITLDQWETDKPLEFRCTDVTDQRAVFTATSKEQRAVTEMIYHRDEDVLRVMVKGEHDNGEAFEFTAEFELQQD